jgi:hypothetical protein
MREFTEPVAERLLRRVLKQQSCNALSNIAVHILKGPLFVRGKPLRETEYFPSPLKREVTLFISFSVCIQALVPILSSPIIIS